MPISVPSFVIGDLPLAVGSAGDNRPRSLFTQGFAKGVRVVAFVGDEVFRAPQAIRKQLSSSNITHVAGGEPEGEWSPDHVGKDVDFAGLATTRGADPLRFRPPLPPNAERCAFT